MRLVGYTGETTLLYLFALDSTLAWCSLAHLKLLCCCVFIVFYAINNCVLQWSYFSSVRYVTLSMKEAHQYRSVSTLLKVF